MDTILVAYAVLCLIAFVQVCVMFVHTFEHGRFHSSRRTSGLGRSDRQQVTLFVPCRGIDTGGERNLRALFEQRYPHFELCFVVETEAEPVVEIIRQLERQYPGVPCRFVFAGEACVGGQKVHNLICATRTVDPKTDVLAFADSDACPHPDWLARLVDRLHDDRHGVATGYRWYTPLAPTLANLLLAAINNAVTGLMSSHRFNLVWGGAWAMRAATFRRLGLPDAWTGTLNDDLVVSRLVHRAGLKVAYDPHCLVTSTADVNFLGLAEFVRRQYLQVRVFVPLWWHAAFWAASLANVMVWTSLVLAVVWARRGGPWWVPAGYGVLYYAAVGCKIRIAANTVQPFVAVERAAFQRVWQFAVWAWPLAALANWLGLVAARLGRTIVWRGIRYRLVSYRETVIEWRTPPVPRKTAPGPEAPAVRIPPVELAGALIAPVLTDRPVETDRNCPVQATA